MITSHGPRCDVCDKYILPLNGERVNWFRVEGIDTELICDNGCKATVSQNDWHLWPDGPLRRAIEAAQNKKELPHDLKNP